MAARPRVEENFGVRRAGFGIFLLAEDNQSPER